MKPYRFNVGIALFNRQGLVFTGKSVSEGPEVILPGCEWQMPQGGIDPDEAIIDAARRELAEETGVTAARFLAATEEFWRYDFPAYVPSGHRLEQFSGQQQRWVAFRFEGEDRDINLSGEGPDFHPEFTEWRWSTLDQAVAEVMPYKRPNYERVAAAFRHFAQPD